MTSLTHTGRKPLNLLVSFGWPETCSTISSKSTLPRHWGKMRMQPHQAKGTVMLWMIAAIFFVLWGGAFLTSHTVGGAIHILLLVALVAVLVRVVQRRKAIP